MTSFQRDHEHARTTTDRASHDDIAPGRSNRAANLHAPTSPMISGLIQRKARDDNGVAADAHAAVSNAAASSGEALPERLMRKFESSLGADLSSVRVHTGAASATAADAVGARAYTVGQDIHFAAGHYDPTSAAGEHLLAHEVAHTVQQYGGTPTRQNKLEVSTPFDAAEVEADRAADAMVRGAPADVTSASGLSRKVFRDQNPKPADPGAQNANPNPNPNANPNPSGDDKSTVSWLVDWVNKETGQTVQSTSNARTGKDAAKGTLKIAPEQGGGDMQTFPWVNAASSGAVAVGTSTLVKGKSGQVSTDIAWGAPPSASAAVTVQETKDDPKREGASQLQAKQKAASAAAADTLDKELQTSGDIATIQQHMLTAAQAAVGAGGTGYTYDVKVTVQPMKMDGKDGNSRAVTAVGYPAPTQAQEQHTATVTVETQRQQLKGSASVTTDDMTAHQEAQGSADHKEQASSSSVTVDTDFENKTVTSVQTMMMNAFDDFTKKLTTTNLSAEGGISGSLAANTSSNASVKDLKIDLGTLVLALAPELGPVSLALSKALGTGTFGGAFTAAFGGTLSGFLKGKASWTDEDLKQTLTQFRSQVNTSVTTETRSRVHTIITSKQSQASSSDNAQASADANAKRKQVSSSTETVGVKYVIGEPSLSVK